MKKILKLVLDPYPLRNIAKKIIKYFNIGTFEQRARIGALKEKSSYGYCLYHGALLAKDLGYKRVSAIEFGVAGGNGLVALENHAKTIEKIFDIKIDVYGFDLGEGLPKPQGYKDCDYFWQPGFYKMDVEKLKRRLTKANLVLGNIKDTVKNFIESENPAPIVSVMFDLDYYSSTLEALKLFDVPERYMIPRVFCCFDDVLGSESLALNEHVGQLLSIEEFNKQHLNKKITTLPHLFAQTPVEGWYHKIRVFHDFSHSQYSNFVGPVKQQNPLSN